MINFSKPILPMTCSRNSLTLLWWKLYPAPAVLTLVHCIIISTKMSTICNSRKCHKRTFMYHLNICICLLFVRYNNNKKRQTIYTHYKMLSFFIALTFSWVYDPFGERQTNKQTVSHNQLIPLQPLVLDLVLFHLKV